jgi:uncharacterized protein
MRKRFVFITIAFRSENYVRADFYDEIWNFDKADAADLREKMAIFKRITKTKKHVFLTTISTFGVRQNAHSLGLIDRALDLDVLFEAVKI